MSKVFTIPFGQPFLENLAEGIIERFQHDTVLLAKSLIILPTRRGCLGLKEAFQQRGCSQILPRIMALADLEQEPMLPGFMAPPLPSAIPSAQQLGLLSQLILKKENISVASALGLARDLMTLIDEIHTSDINLEKLQNLVGSQFAQHWQLTLDFLKIITDYWPAILQEMGMIDGAQRRRDNLRLLATQWYPDYPVVLAGTTATRPATSELAKAILNFDHGMVVLPGFEDAPDNLSPTHPLYTLQQFKNKLDVSNIVLWRSNNHLTGSRGKLLRQFMAPVIMPGEQLSESECQAIESDVSIVEARDTDHEAQLIALKIRYGLETGAESIVVITPDLELTKRLQLHLKRWDIVANTSQGTPLANTVVGMFLRLIVRFQSKPTPRHLLGLLKHPLCYRHLNRAEHLIQVRQLDLQLRRLRQPDLLTPNFLKEENRAWYSNFLKDISGQYLNGKHSLSNHLQDLVRIAETLCSPEKLWIKADGQATQEFLTNLDPHAAAYPLLNLREFNDLLPQLMVQDLVHDQEGIGSPVRILGALEARQSYAPLMILAGLNEGTWPRLAVSDPWLNRQMRLDLGLPDPMRRIGLSAHDFCLGFSAPQVMLTRSLRKGGAATVASRWWLRLQTVLSMHQIKVDQGENLKQWASQLDAPENTISTPEPNPCPPLETRPMQFSTTDIEQLMRDPFGYYARRILKLRKLDAPDEELASRDLGNLIHEGLDLYHRQYGNLIDLQKLLVCGQQVFSPYLHDPHVQHFWWPRFVSVAEWLVDQWHQNEPDQSFTEIEGCLEFPYGGANPVIIKSIADRINVVNEKAIILDYKTGATLPTKGDINQGLSPQLTVEAVLLKNSGFPNIHNKGGLGQLEYWHLKGGKEGGAVVALKDSDVLVEAAEKGVKCLFQHFLLSTTSYRCAPWGESKVKNRDYLQLARFEEWEA